MIKKILCVLATLALIAGMLTGLTSFLRTDDAQSRYGRFFQQDGSYDVLFMGSSHAVMAELPMELWDEYGLTSYNLANYGQTLPMDYWMLKNALNVHIPKLVVMDVYQLVLNHKFYEGHLMSVLNSFAMIPWSRDKVDAINDILPESLRLNAYWPFAAFHSRWQDIDGSFFEAAEPNYEYGAQVGNDLTAMVRYDGQLISRDPSEYTRVTGNPDTYLRKMIELCQANGIEVLLVSIPSCYDAFDQVPAVMNYGYQLAREYNVHFYDGNAANVLDARVDMYDFGHVNASGGKKWTSAVGAYVLENYALTSHKGESGYDAWNEDFAAYNSQKIDRLERQELLSNVLMLCADRNLNVQVKVRGGSGLLSDSQIVALLENLGLGQALPGLARAAMQNGDYSLLLHGGTPVEGTEAPVEAAAALEIIAADALNPEKCVTLRFRVDAQKLP